jgi:hypothetical protein
MRLIPAKVSSVFLLLEVLFDPEGRLYAPPTGDFYQTTRRHTPEDSTVRNNRCVPQTQRSSISSILNTL